MIKKNQRQKLVRAATYERFALFGSVGFAALVIAFGYYVACKTYDPHWMNRAGAAIVAVEGLIAILEYVRRTRLEVFRHNQSKTNIISQEIESETYRSRTERSAEILDREISKAEFQIVIIASLMAVTGEILHGFGDILFVALIGNLEH